VGEIFEVRSLEKKFQMEVPSFARYPNFLIITQCMIGYRMKAILSGENQIDPSISFDKTIICNKCTDTGDM